MKQYDGYCKKCGRPTRYEEYWDFEFDSLGHYDATTGKPIPRIKWVYVWCESFWALIDPFTEHTNGKYKVQIKGCPIEEPKQ